MEVTSIEDVLKILMHGLGMRSVGISHLTSLPSSRSHCLVTMELSPLQETHTPQTVANRKASTLTTTSAVVEQQPIRIQMLDLAGSEKDLDEAGHERHTDAETTEMRSNP